MDGRTTKILVGWSPEFRWPFGYYTIAVDSATTAERFDSRDIKTAGCMRCMPCVVFLHMPHLPPRSYRPALPPTRTLLYTQTQTSESAPAPITAVVKTVSAQLSNDHPDWEVNERRVAKFVKKTMTAPDSNAGAASGTKKTTKFKFTSPIAKLKKKKAAKEELLASAIKEAAPAAEEAVTPIKMAAEDVVETAKDAYKEEKESDSEPWCGGCVIC